MPPIFSLSVAALLAAIPATYALDHYVTVGKGGNKYDPPFVQAKIGDKVKFQFFPKNHTVTQSPFETPCTAQAYGINSGFQFVPDDYNTKYFEFEVKEEKPLWFYCQQAKHCSEDGMVFAVNPPAYGDKTFDAFQQLAKKQHQDTPAPPKNNDQPWGYQQPPKDDKPWGYQQPPKDDKPWGYQQPPKDDKSWGYQQPPKDDNSWGYQQPPKDDKPWEHQQPPPKYDDKPWEHQQPPSQPTDHYVTVGKGGNKYDPPFVNAKIGDKVKFQFFPKNHTVTQSPFETPCTAQPYGINSGFQFVTDDYNTKWFEFEVKEDQPLWFYCQQAKHCSMDGMVFAVNPPAYGDKTFDAFQQLAKKQNQDAPAPPTYNDKPWEHQQPPKDDKPWEHQQPPKDAKPWEHQQPPKDDKPWQYQQPAMNDSKPWDHQQSPSYPTEHYITVGKGGNKYDPPFINAKIGDKVKFQFFPKNHTVTQSPFETPCTAQDWGINSGFQFVSDEYNTKWFEFEVKVDTPLWFYCQQAKHCSMDGMVFAVNPPAYGDKTFDAFQKLAKQQNQDAPANGGDKKYQTSGGASLSGALGGSETSSSGSGFSKWAPVVIGLLAANLFVGLILVVMAVLGYIRRGGRESTRSINVAYAPVREKDNGSFSPPGGSYRDDTRPYSEQ